MHKIKDYMTEIVSHNKEEDMRTIEEYFYKLMCKVHMIDPDMTSWIKSELKIMAYGKVITEEEAKEIVSCLKPSFKWTKDMTDSVKTDYNLDVDCIDFFIVMNLMYSDMKNVLGTGDDEESLKNYINASLDFINDEDAGKDKVFNYVKYVMGK